MKILKKKIDLWKNITRKLLGGKKFAIRTYTHTGDIPTASILDEYFPPCGGVDTSLFVYKSFAAMLWT